MYSAKWIGEGKAIITGSSRGFKHEIIALITLHGGLERVIENVLINFEV